MNWFGQKDRGLGIEIAKFAVRLVKISRNKSGYTLESCACPALPYSAAVGCSANILAASTRYAVAQSGNKLKQSQSSL